MEIGVITSLLRDKNAFSHVSEFGLHVCQLANWNVGLWTEELALKVKEDAKKANVRISAVWTGYPGRIVWNFVEGPVTLGLVPPDLRSERVSALKKGADFARVCGAPAIITHAGFIPESPTDPLYYGFINSVKEVVEYCSQKSLEFWFETGQETPVTLLRAIQDVGLPNLGINLDPANLILYGKGNPVDALDVFGKYVRNIHGKDGFYPTDGRNLGKEVPLGQGKVNYPEFVSKLKEIGFTGDIIIEREISGEQQKIDIMAAVKYLEALIKE